MSTMNPEKQIYQLLGLVQKSGSILIGSDRTIEYVKTGGVFFVLIAKDSGYRTQKTVRDKCNFYQVPFTNWGDSFTISQSVGKDKVSVIGITDKGLAGKIESLLQEN